MPHYVIAKNGTVNQYIDDFDESFLKNSAILITLENDGALVENKNKYYTYHNNIYNKEPFKKKWRNELYFDTYTNKQIDVCVKLCKDLCEKHAIYLKVKDSNVLIKNIYKYMGICYLSNYDKKYNSPNPSFPFLGFKNKIIENE